MFLDGWRSARLPLRFPMPPKLLRPLLIVEFLIAVEAVFAFWSQVGGQYHLDLMFWPWKFGISVGMALLITAITAALVRSEGAMTRRVYLLGVILIAMVAAAGCVTYYYHLNEPSDEDDQGDTQPTISRLNGKLPSKPGWTGRSAQGRRSSAPELASFSSKPERR